MLKAAKVVLGVVVGTFVAYVCFVGGIAVAGGGHGWNGAFFLGCFSVVFSVPAFVVLALAPKTGRPVASFIVVMAAILDFFLVAGVISDLGYGFSRGKSLSWLWLAFWLSWQVAALVAWRMCERDASRYADDTLRAPMG